MWFSELCLNNNQVEIATGRMTGALWCRQWRMWWTLKADLTVCMLSIYRIVPRICAFLPARQWEKKMRALYLHRMHCVCGYCLLEMHRINCAYLSRLGLGSAPKFMDWLILSLQFYTEYVVTDKKAFIPGSVCHFMYYWLLVSTHININNWKKTLEHVSYGDQT